MGDYKIIRPLGKGGTGRFFLCEHKNLGGRAAVKLVRAAPGAGSTQAERFFHEACTCEAFKHPNIVRIFEVGRQRRLFYLVMEYIDGVTLGELVRVRGPLPVGRAAAYARQAALGLHHIHEKGWVHGDVKPENVMLASNGTVKLLDFGTARPQCWPRRTPGNDCNHLFGTLDFLPPEQVLDPTRIDKRADIYSLGATLYYLLTAHSPCPGGDMVKRILNLLTADIPPVRSLRPEIRKDMAVIVHKMLTRRVQNRFQLMSEVVLALAPWENHGLSSAHDKN